MDSRTNYLVAPIDYEKVLKNVTSISIVGARGMGKSTLAETIAIMLIKDIMIKPVKVLVRTMDKVLNGNQSSYFNYVIVNTFEEIEQACCEYVDTIIIDDDVTVTLCMNRANAFLELIGKAKNRNQVFIIISQFALNNSILRKSIQVNFVYKSMDRSDRKRMWEHFFSTFLKYNDYEWITTQNLWKKYTFLVSYGEDIATTDPKGIVFSHHPLVETMELKIKQVEDNLRDLKALLTNYKSYVRDFHPQ